MSIFKKTSAALLALTMSFSLASCGKNSTWAARINDFEVRAGIFISYQMSAYYEAQEFMTEEDTDVLKITIEDKPAEEWINDKATSDMQKFVAIEQKFDELGLSFKDNEDKKASNYVDQIWSYYADTYENLGIGQQSELDMFINSYKKAYIFDHYYAVGGEKEVTEKEVKDYIYDNYALINYIEMPLKDGEENLLKSDGKAKMMDMANEYIVRAKAGEDFNALAAEFNKYYEDMVAAANPVEEETATDSNEIVIDASEFLDDTDATAEVTEIVDNSVVIEKSGSTPNQAVVDKIFSGDLKIGDYTVVELDEVYYVVSFMDVLSQENYYEDNESSIRHAIKDDEFDETVDTWVQEQTVVKNDAAYKKYKAKKFAEEE